MSDNIEQRDDGKWVATCPFDGEEFVADNKEDALTEEGIYRSENYIDSNGNIGRQTDAEDRSRNIVDDWKQDQVRS